MRTLPALLLMSIACSNQGKGFQATLDTGPDDTRTDDGQSTLPDPTETDPDDGTAPQPTDTATSGSTTTPVSACLYPPTGGAAPPRTDCEFVPNPSGTPFAATIEWAMTNQTIDPTRGVVLPTYHFAEHDGWGSVFQAPAVGQMTDDNGDGRIDAEDVPDIAVVMAQGPTAVVEGVLRVISGDGAAVHDTLQWAVHTNGNGTHQYAPYQYAGVAVGDIDGDDAIEIATLVTRQSDKLCFPAYYQVDASGILTLERVYAGANYNCGGHAPSLADIDGDGAVDLIYGRAVFESDFTQKWYAQGGRGWYGRDDYPYPDGYWNSGYHSFAHDVDGDGVLLEVIAGRTIYRHDGSTFCTLGRYVGGVWVEATDGYPSVADLLRFPGDVQGEPEIVVTGNEWVSVYHGVPDYDPNGLARCVLVDELPNRPEDDPTVPAGMPAHPTCNPAAAAFGGPSTIADFDGDGDNEIAVAGGCWYSVFAFDGAGQMFRYAMAQTQDWSSASTGSTVFDFQGDGSSEVVFSDEDAVYVWGFDPTATAPWNRLDPYLMDTEHKSWTIHEYPLVADVDNDGKAEIVVVNSYRPGFEDRFGIYVLGAADDDWVSARPLWHQHAYAITNVEDDGTIGYCEPNYAPFSKEDFDSFRLQAPGAFGTLAAPNLTVAGQTCQESCGDVDVWIQVTNEGAYISTGPDVVLALYGVDTSGGRTLVGSAKLGSFLPPATTSDAYAFRVSGWSAYAYLLAVVDDASIAGIAGDGVAKECDESDNAAIIPLTGLCP